MIVYRIEDAQGVGPYRSELAPSSLQDEFLSDVCHPLPIDDKLLMKNRRALMQSKPDGRGKSTDFDEQDFLFCFTSQEQVKAWFHDERMWQEIDDHFRINVYDVRHVVIGDHQSQFLHNLGKYGDLSTEYASPVQSFTPMEFYRLISPACAAENQTTMERIMAAIKN